MHASRDQQKEAIADLHAGIVRGFTDLRRVQRAEGWGRMRNTMDFYELEQFLPSLIEVESAWAGWDAFKVSPEHAPAALAPVLDQRDELLARVDRMAPALGPYLTPLWKKTIDRAITARVEAYVAKYPEGTDLERAAAALMTLYTGGPTCRWEILSPDVAKRVESVAGVLLEKFPQSPLRPSALFCRALARSARRDENGALTPAAGDQILADLDAALAASPDVPFAPSAVAGLVRTEAELGRMDRASKRYSALQERYAKDGATWDNARSQLGELALRAGGLPEFHGTTLDGVEVEKRSLTSRVTIIDFWATWCRPCIAEFPTLRRLTARHGDGVAVLGINLDRQDELTTDALRAWVAREKVPGRHVQAGGGWDSNLVKTFGVTEIPFTVVVGADGSIVAVNARGKKLEKAVADAVSAVAVASIR